jgi:formylglycine-generating enzyme required for sulfatase activity
LQLPADYLSRTGYRLPTEAEWEYACRAGAVSSRYYGSSEELLPRYAWYFSDADGRAWPVGQKRPNDLGLFDLYGNVRQWCQESGRAYEPGRDSAPAEDVEDKSAITHTVSRVLRGGAFDIQASFLRSADRYKGAPIVRNVMVGLRVARTWR